MFGKKITLIVLPQGAPKRVKTYHIPRLLPIACLAIGLIGLIGLAAFSGYTQRQYSRFADQTAELERLRQKAVQQNMQIYAFNDKIRLVEREMAKLRQYERKLQASAREATLPVQPRRRGQGGSDSESTGPGPGLKATTAELVRQMHRDLDRLLSEASIHEQNQQKLGSYFEDSKSIMASTPDCWPVQGTLTSTFGYRSSPFGRQTEFHRGIDLSAPTGTPIIAPADGLVVSSEWNSGYGLILAINHGYGIVTRYAHLSQCYVEPGQFVRRGQRVASVGRSGRTTGAHLHYEVILKGIPVNPARFLTARK
ncbi:MAG: M23 family metallopeptidase [Proteobacteria bacterium]|nr:M23 family metallopeptidase [Pseudomonadota bacterium]